MQHMLAFDKPALESPTLLCAFAGWPDAGESATTALRYLVGRLGARKFAQVDPEEFYNFTHLRPHTDYDDQGQRVITWPANEFFYWNGRPRFCDLVVLIGIEPHLRWRTFTGTLLNCLEELEVERVVHLGALLDAVPHTRQVHLSGTARGPELEERLHELGLKGSGYRGPTGASAVFIQACRQKGLPNASIWGHMPHYLQVSPNPRVSLALLHLLQKLVEVDLDLEELRAGAVQFEERVQRALSKEPGVLSYVRRLEQHYDAQQAPEPTPSPQELVQDLEEFLRRQRSQGVDPESSPPQP